MFHAAVATVLLMTVEPSEAVDSTSWVNMFRVRGAPLPAPLPNCQVCFFEKSQFGGNRFCVGPRPSDCDNVLIISAPSTIGSIQFSTSSPACSLVTNVRVLDPPYDRHMDLVFEDVVDTTYEDVVQELYVESAGRACFMAAKDIDHYGKCYNASVPQVDETYRDALYEAILFRTKAHNFFVTVYEEPNFEGLSKQLNTSTDDLKVWTADNVPTMKSLQMHIRSIAFTETFPTLGHDTHILLHQ